MDLQPQMNMDIMGEDQINPTDMLSNLPEEILIEHIFSLFNLKQSCTTSCVSRKFHRLLSTNPVIDIDLGESGYPTKVFWEIDSIMDRYVEKDILIRKFNLQIKLDEILAQRFRWSIISWIETAVQNQVEYLSVSIYPYKEPPIHDDKDMDIPADIVLSSKSLKVLNLSNLEIVSKTRDYGYVNLGLLEVLQLDSVVCKDDGLVSYLLSSCPINMLGMYGCFISEINISQPNIRKAVIWQECVLPYDVLGEINLQSRSIEEFFYDGGWENKPDCPVSIKYPEQLVSLRKLSIVSAAITDEMVKNVVPRLPLLEDLELNKCYCLKSTKISTSSLKKLKLRQCKNLELVEINAVNLQMFSFRAILDEAKYPQLLFLTESPAYCKASISQDAYHGYRPIRSNHFIRLREFLVKSNLFNVLTLHFCRMKKVTFNLEDVTEIPQGPAYKINKLKLWAHCYNLQEANLSALMEGVFWTCNPSVLSLPTRMTEPSDDSTDPNEQKVVKIIMDEISKFAMSADHPLKGIEVRNVHYGRPYKKFGIETCGTDNQLHLQW